MDSLYFPSVNEILYISLEIFSFIYITHVLIKVFNLKKILSIFLASTSEALK